jgi:hypothetical protein
MVDFLDDLLDGKTKEEEDAAEALPASNKDITDLKSEIEELNKEKAGLLKGVKAERSKRQEINGKLTQLTDTVNGLLVNRENAVKNEITEAVKPKGLPVTWTEDGEGFVGTDAIDEALSPYKQEIMNLKQQLELTNSRAAAVDEAEKVRRAIVGEDERYEKAYNKYQSARKWVVDQVTDFAKQRNITQALTSGDALDHVFDNDLESEFETTFPGLDLERIVTAEDSKRHFRKTMSTVADAMTPSEDDTLNAIKPDSRFQKVLNKPNSLSGTQNAKAGELSIMDKLESLSSQDLVDIDDKTADKLMAAIAAEEKNGLG